MSTAPHATGQKVYFVSLGCPKNRVDSELMLGDLAARDYEIVQSPDDADVLVVNTCGFVEDAREESVDTSLSWRRSGSLSQARW